MLNLGHVHAQSQNLPQSFFVSFHLLQNNDLKLNDSYIHHSATHYKKGNGTEEMLKTMGTYFIVLYIKANQKLLIEILF